MRITKRRRRIPVTLGALAGEGFVFSVGAAASLYKEEGSRAVAGDSVGLMRSLGSREIHAVQIDPLLRPPLVGGVLQMNKSSHVFVVNLPQALSGTMIVAGTEGCVVDTASLSAGNSSIGPQSVLSFPIGAILHALGNFVGVLFSSRILSNQEIARALAIFQRHGSGSKLVLGPELLGTTWLATNATVAFNNGVLSVTSTTATGNSVGHQTVDVVPVSAYAVTARSERKSASYAVARTSVFDTAPTSVNIGTISSGADVGVPVEGGRVIISPADGSMAMSCYNNTNTASGGVGEYSNLSIKRFVKEV